MKAIVFQPENGVFEAQLENHSVYSSTPEETKKDFLARVEGEVEADFMENFEPTVLTAAKLKKMSLEKLTQMLDSEVTSPVGQSMIEAAIEAKAKAPAPKKEKAPAPKKEKAPVPTLAEVERDAEAARINYVGKLVEFVDFKGDERHGLVKAVIVDKRVMKAYLRINETETNKMFHTRINSISVRVDATGTQKMLEEREQQRLLKEQEKQAAKEAKAQARAEAKAKREEERAAKKAAAAEKRAAAKAKRKEERAAKKAAKEAKAAAAQNNDEDPVLS